MRGHQRRSAPVTSSAPWPRLTSASNRSSIAVRRSPSSRVTAASNAALSCKPTSCMAAPRHKARASRSSLDPPRILAHCGPDRRGVRTARRRQRRVPPSTGSRPSAPRPPLRAAPSAVGRPGVARRSPRRTAGCSPQIQSTSVAFGTTRPGSSARAINSARNRAPGTSAKMPSSVRTSNDPSIPICTLLILPRAPGRPPTADAADRGWPVASACARSGLTAFGQS